MKQEIKCCETCGFEIVGRWERLSAQLVRSLNQFHAVARSRARNLNACGFTFSQRSNFQKLQWFGLAERAGKGEWQITQLGESFIEGFADVPQQVFKVKGKAGIERVSVERVHISDVIKKAEPFKTKFERIKLKQENLFV